MTINKLLEMGKSIFPNYTSKIDEIQFCAEYAEPGYSTTHELILFGNWNPRNFDGGEDEKRWRRFVNLLEKKAELEWSDEWSTCDECARAIRTRPDSYSWWPSYVIGDGWLCCADCASNQADSVIEQFIGNPDTCLTIDTIDLSEHGFTKLPREFESGFHYGQDASPRKIAAALHKRGVYRFLFKLDSAEQFSASFSVWVAKEEISLLGEDLEDSEVNGPSNAARLEKALRTL